MILLSTVQQSSNSISTEAIFGIIGVLLGTLLGYLLPKIGKVYVTRKDLHDKYYNIDQFGHFDKVIYNGEADGYGFECDFHFYNSKNIGVGISKCYLEIKNRNKRIRFNIEYGSLYNLQANTVHIETILAKFEPENTKIMAGSVKKLYFYYYFYGGIIRHRKVFKVPEFKKKEIVANGTRNE